MTTGDMVHLLMIFSESFITGVYNKVCPTLRRIGLFMNFPSELLIQEMKE